MVLVQLIGEKQNVMLVKVKDIFWFHQRRRKMKTRIIHTRFWQDNFVSSLNHKEKLVFIYLLTNDRVNLVGIYELPDKYIKVDLNLTESELQRIKQKLHKANRILFKNGWIKIVRHDKYNSYKGKTVNKAKKKELSNIPVFFIQDGGGIDTSIDTSIDTPNNHKSKTINQKSKIKNNKYSSLKDLKESDFKEIAEMYKVPVSFVISKVDDIKNYCESRGRVYKNYKAVLRDWVKRDAIKLKKEVVNVNRVATI